MSQMAGLPPLEVLGPTASLLPSGERASLAASRLTLTTEECLPDSKSITSGCAGTPPPTTSDLPSGVRQNGQQSLFRGAKSRSSFRVFRSYTAILHSRRASPTRV